MKADIKQWQRTMDFLDRLILGLSIIYGLFLLLIYFTVDTGLMPGMFNPLVIGLLFFLLGIYPLARKKSRERLRKGKRFF